MKSNLDAALDLLSDGLPLPLDLTTALLADGIDVGALEAATRNPNEQHDTTPVFDWA